MISKRFVRRFMVILALGAALLAAAATAAPRNEASPAPPAVTATGDTYSSLEAILFLITGSLRQPIPARTVVINTEGGIKMFRAPLEKVPEAREPVKVLDRSPVSLKVVKIQDDGLIFSWDPAKSYFKESIYFIEETHEIIDGKNVMRSPKLEGPGLYAYVEMKTTGIGETVFIFRVVP